VDANTLVSGLDKYVSALEVQKRVTPKMFLHNIKSLCLKQPQTIVLPEVGPALCPGCIRIHGCSQASLWGRCW
jgi:hypothetical protein